MLTQNGDSICVDVIGSGGGQGVIFKLSWWSEESFISIVPKILSQHGFS